MLCQKSSFPLKTVSCKLRHMKMTVRADQSSQQQKINFEFISKNNNQRDDRN